MNTTPKTTRSGGLDPGISQWVISHGPSPTKVPGATTKKAADPSAAVEVRTDQVLAGIVRELGESHAVARRIAEARSRCRTASGSAPR